MNQKKSIVVISDNAINIKDLVIVAPLSAISEIVEEESFRKAKRIISSIKPYVTGSSGQRLLKKLENELNAPFLEDKKSTQQIRLVDKSRNEVVSKDFSNVRQFIER